MSPGSGYLWRTKVSLISTIFRDSVYLFCRDYRKQRPMSGIFTKLSSIQIDAQWPHTSEVATQELGELVATFFFIKFTTVTTKSMCMVIHD